MIDPTGQPWLSPAPDARGPVALADLPPVDDRYLDELRTVETEAREAGRGLWSACP